MNEKTGCLICGASLQYQSEEFLADCSICNASYSTSVTCKERHFVCDTCHSLGANDWIEKVCAISTETNPYILSIQLMEHPSVKMHGPEHHFIVPAVMLCVYYNLKKQGEKKSKAIAQARQRAEKVPGGFCGFCGNCGAAVGSGIYVSVVLEANPLSKNSWSLCNRMTSQSLAKVADHGGPRCCKRDTFLSIESAVSFSETYLEVVFGGLKTPTGTFSELNKECLLGNCKFYAGC